MAEKPKMMIDASSVQCPDCNSEISFDLLMPNVYQLVVSHDETCPWFAQREREQARRES